MKSLFVTGTDTGVGKTLVSALLVQGLSARQKTGYFKPVQSGTIEDDDTKTLKSLTNPERVQWMLPSFSFKAPMSPDRAALKENAEIEVNKIVNDWNRREEAFWVVEGAGGLEVPLTTDKKISDLVAEINAPVLLVSSTRLGTINHTLLSIESLVAKGIPVEGIVLVGEKDPGLKECIENHSPVKVLFEVPFFEEVSFQSLQEYVNTDPQFNQFVDGLGDKDSRYIWHPFTQHNLVKDHPLVTKGEGVHLYLESGEKLIDAISSWWVNLHGHSNPVLAEAIANQAKTLEHVIFAGYTHQPAIDLVEQLVQVTQQRGCDFQRGFFSDNGSTSVEVALKIAYQYHQNCGDYKRRKFLALNGSYHGDTIGAMSVGDRQGFHEVFEPLLFPAEYIDPDDIESLKSKVAENPGEYAAIILEPMVQGAGGMRMYSPDFLTELGVVCRENNILVVADEIFTGFYRTGKFFAFEHSEMRPDLLCLSKGLTGGFLPMSLTLTSEKIFQAFSGDHMKQAFLHGHSYTANPMACAVGLASLKLLLSETTQQNIAMIQKITDQRIQAFEGRSLGTIGAFEAFGQKGYFTGNFSSEFQKKAVKRGVLLRPLGSTVYTVPPYCISENQLNEVYDVIEDVMMEMK